jgi:dCMP deaminase
MLRVAREVAARSTCARLRVGAVVAVNDRIASTGYNGAPRSIPHCDCEPVGDRPCDRSVHAEANALLFAGQATVGATLYVTHSPCLACAGMIINSGITTVVYAQPYRSGAGLDQLAAAGIPARLLSHVPISEGAR